MDFENGFEDYVDQTGRNLVEWGGDVESMQEFSAITRG